MSAHPSASVDVEAIRAAFPALERDIAPDTPLVYLDNAATTLTPEPVLDAMDEYYRSYNANVHRGLHTLSQEASVAYEDAHDDVASFIGASGGREELIFTKNTTESLNLVAQAWGLAELGPEDEIVISAAEHHSNLVTWQQVAARTGATLRILDLTPEGHIDLAHAAEIIGPNTAVVSVLHVSNTLGTINPLDAIGDLARASDALFVVDGAQAVPIMPVDVEAIDADFYAFSGHKMAGPTGIGCLYGKRALLEDMEPFLFGGEMIRTVSYETASWNDLPWKYEAGTPPSAEGIGLGAAVEYLASIGMDAIANHERELTAYALERLAEIDGLVVYGPDRADERGGLVSFTMADIHAHDIAEITNDYGVAIRAGHHCTQPLHDRLGVAATTRASFYAYNTRQEIDVLLEALRATQQLFA